MQTSSSIDSFKRKAIKMLNDDIEIDWGTSILIPENNY